jgi:hypothetical protein
LDSRFSQAVLVRMDELRVREIAGALGLPPGTVKCRLSATVSRLRNSKVQANLFGFSNVVQVWPQPNGDYDQSKLKMPDSVLTEHLAQWSPRLIQSLQSGCKWWSNERLTL